MVFLRWILLLPAALGACFLAHVFGVAALAIGHGVQESFDFWAATDMNQWWISGTITLVFSRGISGAFSTWVATRVAPSHKLSAARLWIGFLGFVAILVFGSVLLYARDSMSFSHWYRSVVEFVALLGGAAIMYSDLRSEL